ncbi:hypothetical protein BDC45DRAFT_178996 [Circinella umbellata]|nr:hypothetical protein BDC45DRAFT_178996 [Circinella umbellata]
MISTRFHQTPILLEVQSVVDDNFLHRLVLYCEEVNKKYGSVPVVLVVTINKTRDSVMRKTRKNKGHGFLFQLPSFPWAKKCLILNNDSIRDHITSTPLSPLVALGAFLIAQKQSILDHDQRHDPTIRQFYTISQNAFENVVIDENTTVVDLLCICENTQSKFQDAIEALEDLPNNSSKKRAMDSMNDGLEIIQVAAMFRYLPQFI